MKYLVTGKEMKYLDRNTSDYFHVPEIVLMEQAASAFVNSILDNCEGTKEIIVVCGTGNNGADGIAIARLLNQNGFYTSIYVPFMNKTRPSESFQTQYEIYTRYQYVVRNEMDWDDKDTLMIDAVFGIGLSRTIVGDMAELILQMDQKPGFKIAVDIPSGICADTGSVLGVAVHVNKTITFSFAKVGHFMWPGVEYCGTVKTVPMGITMDSWLDKQPTVATCEWKDIMKLHSRVGRSNKGTYGKLLVIAGSVNMAGAAFLCAKSAYRTGCGLVKIFTREENRNALQTLLPEAILETYGEQLEESQIEKCIDWADGIAIGPGIGCNKEAYKIVEKVLAYSTKSIVMDADALNIVSQNQSLLNCKKTDVIVTPHLGEMSRLSMKSINELQCHMIENARELAKKYRVICVLKDAHTVISIPNGMTYVNLSGNDGMATAGSGDVLTGIIGSLLVQQNSDIQSAVIGTYIHGLAGDAALVGNGANGIIADDIIEGLKSIWKRVKEYEEE